MQCKFSILVCLFILFPMRASAEDTPACFSHQLEFQENGFVNASERGRIFLGPGDVKLNMTNSCDKPVFWQLCVVKADWHEVPKIPNQARGETASGQKSDYTANLGREEKIAYDIVAKFSSSELPPQLQCPEQSCQSQMVMAVAELQVTERLKDKLMAARDACCEKTYLPDVPFCDFDQCTAEQDAFMSVDSWGPYGKVTTVQHGICGFRPYNK